MTEFEFQLRQIALDRISSRNRDHQKRSIITTIIDMFVLIAAIINGLAFVAFGNWVNLLLVAILSSMYFQGKTVDPPRVDVPAPRHVEAAQPRRYIDRPWLAGVCIGFLLLIVFVKMVSMVS